MVQIQATTLNYRDVPTNDHHYVMVEIIVVKVVYDSKQDEIQEILATTQKKEVDVSHYLATSDLPNLA